MYSSTGLSIQLLRNTLRSISDAQIVYVLIAFTFANRYLGASYDVPSLVKKLLHQLASKETIVVNVYDTTNESAPINMYGTDVTDTGLLKIRNLDFGDPLRKHEMHCRLDLTFSQLYISGKGFEITCFSNLKMFLFGYRFKQKPPLPWMAINASAGVLVITFLVGHIFYAAISRIAKVEADYRMMVELKARAEAADVAKSQVHIFIYSFGCTVGWLISIISNLVFLQVQHFFVEILDFTLASSKQ